MCVANRKIGSQKVEVTENPRAYYVLGRVMERVRAAHTEEQGEKVRTEVQQDSPVGGGKQVLQEGGVRANVLYHRPAVKSSL